MPEDTLGTLKGKFIKELILQRYPNLQAFTDAHGWSKQQYSNLTLSLSGQRSFGDSLFLEVLKLLGLSLQDIALTVTHPLKSLPESKAALQARFPDLQKAVFEVTWEAIENGEARLWIQGETLIYDDPHFGPALPFQDLRYSRSIGLHRKKADVQDT